MALGARPYDVSRLVVVHGMKLALAGVAIGAVGALALVCVSRSLLYEISFEDPVTLVAVSLFALLVAVVACYLPARHATNACPMATLRCE